MCVGGVFGDLLGEVNIFVKMGYGVCIRNLKKLFSLSEMQNM